MAVKKVFIAGFGGQGVLLIGQLLAYAAMYENREVTWMPSYGPEMRGGTANCSVVISDAPIASPLITECDILAVMNGPSLDKFENILVPGGELFINESIVPQKSRRKDISVNYVDCTGISSEKLGNGKAANMVMLGAMIKKTGIIDFATMDKVCEVVFSGSKAKHIPLNIRALHSWEA
ncbi:MAG: 2-oxoacid:acceptor oxidoreductase family protein [Bacillota bacterium]